MSESLIPGDLATQTTLALIKAKTDNIDVALSTRTKPADAQHVIVDSGVTTGLTDTQLRATPVPISGTVSSNATQTGTWTVQPGNTANTTAWKVDGSAVTQPVGGDTAAGGTDAGNPVKVGGIYNSTLPTLTNGQRGNLQIGTRGSLQVQINAQDSTTTLAFTTPADGVSNSTSTALVNNRNSIFNGTTWDRQPGTTNGTYEIIRDAAGNARGANVDASGNLNVVLGANQSVNNAQVNGVTVQTSTGTAGTGTQRVAVASDSSITANAGTNLNTSALALESGGNLATIASAVHTEDAASANADKGFAVQAIRDDTLNSTSGTEGDYEFLHTTADGALWVTQAPSTSNGWSTFMASSGDGSTALTNTAQAVKASAGTLGGWYIYNPNATAAYVIIYNTASGSVTVGTTNPQMVLCIPATSAANVEFGNGINFTTAIAVAATTTGGGNTAPTTALEANFYYK